MASSVLVVPKAGENSNSGNISLQLSLLFEAVSKDHFFFFLIASMMLSYRAWLRVGPQHVNEWSIASKAGSQDHLRLELWYPSSPDVTTESVGQSHSGEILQEVRTGSTWMIKMKLHHATDY